MSSIGFSKVAFTGRLPKPMAGFGGLREADGAHDPLYAKCLVYKNGISKLVLLSLDLVAADYTLCRAITSSLSELGFDKKETAIFATHTHSAPAGASNTSTGALKGFQETFGTLDTDFISLVAQACRSAVAAALCDMAEYKLLSFKVDVGGVVSNRTDRSLPGDRELTGFIFERTDGKRCLVYNYACHPTVLNADNRLRTADLPGAVAARLHEFDEVILLNGSCGDISTRFTRKGYGFAELDRFADIEAAAIKQGCGSAKICSSSEISQRMVPITLKTKEPAPVEEAEKASRIYKEKLEKAKQSGASATELRSITSYIEAASASATYSKNYSGNTEYELDCRILTIDGERICCCPCELYSELSNPLKAETGALFAGYANGYFLYMADKKAHDDNNYEACSSPFARGEGERLIEILREELKK